MCKSILPLLHNFTLLLSFYARRSRASHELRRSESKKARFKELSNNISDRSEAYGTGILSDLLLGERSEVSGKSAIYYNNYNFYTNAETRQRCGLLIFFRTLGSKLKVFSH